MERKRSIGVLVILLLAFPLVCFGQDDATKVKPPNLIEPSADGLYQIKNVTIKFIPPDGWKKVNWNTLLPPPMIDFMYSKDGIMKGPGIGILIITNCDSQLMEQIRGKDGAIAFGSKLLQEEDIIFMGEKAYSCTIAVSKKAKARNIFFIKSDIAYQISFTANEEEFDNLLPVVDESLKTFEIISPVPK